MIGVTSGSTVSCQHGASTHIRYYMRFFHFIRGLQLLLSILIKGQSDENIIIALLYDRISEKLLVSSINLQIIIVIHGIMYV